MGIFDEKNFSLTSSSQGREGREEEGRERGGREEGEEEGRDEPSCEIVLNDLLTADSP